jgi:AmmeMemoRadiSam system protein B
MIKKCIQILSVSAAIAGALFLSSCSKAPSVVTYENPYDSPQEFMEGIYQADHQVDPPSAFYKIRAVIVPHHLTATRSIAAGIRMLQHQSFKKILLISPDHFAKCPTLLCTTNSLYHTQFGTVKAVPSVVEQLATHAITTIQPDIFVEEHGIYAVLPYIAHYFPGIPVTPIALSQNPWRTSSGALLEAIQEAVDPDTLLIVSSDFSHYLSLGKANVMDEETAEALFSKNLEGIAHLKNPSHSDCPNCLWALASLANKRGFYNPSVIFHTNSAVLLNNKSVQSTTSHFAMAWYQNATLSSADLTVAGDVTMTRVIKTPKLSTAMQTFWSGTGARLVNLEGPLAEHCPANRTMFNFCNGLSLWKGMLGLATHWGIMNNHLLDQHTQGIADTRRLMTENGETLVGDHMVDAGAYRFIALTALMNPVLDTPALNIAYQYHQVIQELKNKDPSKMTVVLVHEGKEYRALTSDAENTYLQTFIDAGADVVIAAHTHVVSDMTIYKGKPIFRGVGNFIFDQHDALVTSTGKAVRLRLQKDGVLFESSVQKI